MFEVGRCLMGSQNYRLNGPDSDKDYKVFLCPDFNDLYKNKRVEKNDLPANVYNREFYSPMDCRTFAAKLVEGNVNCVEYIFSLEQNGSSDFFEFLEDARQLYSDGYVMVCWDKFFASVEGLIKNSLDRNGESRKTVTRAYYFQMFVMTLLADNFKMDHHTWRGNGWNEDLRRMRFDEECWMPTREQIETTFAYLKETCKASVERFKKYNPSGFENLQKRGEALEAKMKAMVAQFIYEEVEEDYINV